MNGEPDGQSGELPAHVSSSVADEEGITQFLAGDLPSRLSTTADRPITALSGVHAGE